MSLFVAVLIVVCCVLLLRVGGCRCLLVFAFVSYVFVVGGRCVLLQCNVRCLKFVVQLFVVYFLFAVCHLAPLFEVCCCCVMFVVCCVCCCVFLFVIRCACSLFVVCCFVLCVVCCC